MRRIAHVDMDAFFAAVEQQRRPELVGKPVVIGGRGDPNRRGVAATASYEARRYGIHSAMPLRTALKLCPHAVFLPVDYEEYKRVSRLFKAALLEITPLMQDVGIDEVYLDVSDVEGTARAIAGRIKIGILDATGLTSSVGIAPNKMLAKIASDLDKPDGMTLLTEADIPTRIWPLPARRIPGIGPRAEERLKEIGIRTIGELAQAPLTRLARRFGRSHAEWYHRAAQGIDERPVVLEREPKSRSRETTFQQDLTDRREIAATVARLAKQVAEELASRGYLTRTVGIKLRFSDFTTVTRDRTLPDPTGDAAVIRRAAFDCLSRVDVDRPVRLIGVRAGTLEPHDHVPESGDLFGSAGEP